MTQEIEGVKKTKKERKNRENVSNIFMGVVYPCQPMYYITTLNLFCKCKNHQELEGSPFCAIKHVHMGARSFRSRSGFPIMWMCLGLAECADPSDVML